MEKRHFLFAAFCIILIAGCKEPEDVKLSPQDFAIRSVNWDPEIEFDCGHCDKPICRWEMSWELEYQFNPKDGKNEAVCWYYTNEKVKIKPLLQRNKMRIGVGKLADPNLLLDCWKDHKVGLCCAYTVDELLNDEYICKDVLLETLCP